MEVRIKEGNGYVDAEWTIEDGVMVVSPKGVKWKPIEGGELWYPYYVHSRTLFIPFISLFNFGRDKNLFNKGWCFKTEQECQELCNRLNEAINSVKP